MGNVCACVCVRRCGCVLLLLNAHKKSGKRVRSTAAFQSCAAESSAHRVLTHTHANTHRYTLTRRPPLRVYVWYSVFPVGTKSPYWQMIHR